ncbi:MAG: outer membrane beta-barrel protein [Chitinophagaceae bacterium]|nr:outer membrane beta-barrel protein [Chitinophagaceae bacterium]
MMKAKLLLALLFFAFSAVAQNIELTGTVSDTSENKQLSKATIALLRAKDSVLLKFVRTTPDGKFRLPVPAQGKYILMISYPGYADYADFVDLQSSQDLGLINMITKAVLLQTVVVRGSAVRMKGDTLAFIADSFKTREGATVEDLLKRLPGLSVNQKGEITAQGQKVQKVLVDGDEFFGDDPTLATRNLQALAVKEVQVFDKKSDQATFTGVDDGQTQKTINLKLKDEFKKGYFGKVKLAGGLPNRWENQAMLNAFKDKRKLSVYGIMANTNNNSLGWSEESQFGGNMGTNTQIGDDGSVMMWSSGDEFGGTGGYYGEGLPSSWTLGTSYGNKWNENRSNVTGAYRYQKIKTVANSYNTTQNILPDTQFFNNQRAQNEASRWRHKGLIRSELFIDSMQSITFDLNGSYGESSNYSRTFSEALTGKQLPVNKSDRTTIGAGTQAQFNGTALYKLKFKKKGRTFSANLGNQYSDNNSDGLLLTYNEFYNASGLYSKDTIDQKKLNTTRSNAVNARLAYSEPIGKKGILEINYGINQSVSNQQRLSYNKLAGKYDDLDSVFSNDFKFKTLTNRTGAGYRYSGKLFQFGFGGDVAFTDWRQDDRFRDTTRHYNFTNFFPRAEASYKLGQYSRVRLSYNGSTQAPSANQLQPVADNNDPLNIQIGNPNLVQSFNHRISLNYNFWKVLSNTGMWMGAWFNPTSNAFSTKDVVDAFGKRTSQTVNVNGNYNFGAYIGYNLKWKKPDIQIDLNFDPSINRFTNFVNGIENRTNSTALEFGYNLRKSKDDKYDLSFNQRFTYSSSKSSIRPDINTTYWTGVVGMSANIDLPAKIVFNTDFDYNWRQRTSVFDQNNNAFIWNASIEKKIFKKKDVKMGFSVRDLLNQNIGFRRNISSNFVSERTYDVIRRYWMVTFSWSFNKGPQKAEEDNW